MKVELVRKVLPGDSSSENLGPRPKGLHAITAPYCWPSFLGLEDLGAACFCSSEEQSIK